MSAFSKRYTQIDVEKVIPKEGERSGRRITGPLNDHVPVDSASRRNGSQLNNIKDGSPWTDYEQRYGLRWGPGVCVAVAAQKDFPFDEVTVRRFSSSDMKGTLRSFKQGQIANVVTVLDVFRFGEMTYGIYEHMPVSLYQIANSPLLDGIRLAAILGQVLNGLDSLYALGLEHKSISSSNVLAHPNGDVKIAGHEYITPRPANNDGLRDVRAIGEITMELMQGYVKEEGTTGVDDPSRWSSDVLDFLSRTTSAASVKDLMNHALVRLPWEKETLKSVVSFTIATEHRGCTYPPRGT